MKRRTYVICYDFRNLDRMLDILEDIEKSIISDTFQIEEELFLQNVFWDTTTYDEPPKRMRQEKCKNIAHRLLKLRRKLNIKTK